MNANLPTVPAELLKRATRIAAAREVAGTLAAGLAGIVGVLSFTTSFWWLIPALAFMVVAATTLLAGWPCVVEIEREQIYDGGPSRPGILLYWFVHSAAMVPNFFRYWALLLCGLITVIEAISIPWRGRMRPQQSVWDF